MNRIIPSTRFLSYNRMRSAMTIGKRYKSLDPTSSSAKSKDRRNWLVTFTLAGVGMAGVSYIARQEKQEDRSQNDHKHNNINRPSDGIAVKSNHDHYNRRLKIAIDQSRQLISQIKEESGSPGISIAVSCNGKMMWSEGFGVSDIENAVPCTPQTVMRIASISKPISAAIIAKLWEDGKLDLDAPISKYVKDFPDKTFDSQPVEITTRMLLSHLGGIRAYEKVITDSTDKNEKDKNADENKVEKLKNGVTLKVNYKEFLLKDRFNSVTEALKLFKDDPLVVKPGTEYHYTTHGWTLLSGVIEGAAEEKLLKLMGTLFKQLGMTNTQPEFHETLIYNRARYYRRNKKGKLRNAPYVDISYKWAGGGLVSNVADLVKFGNVMLYSRQYSTIAHAINESNYDSQDITKRSIPKGYLNSDTVKAMWTPASATLEKVGFSTGYGLGWTVADNKIWVGYGHEELPWVGHSGGAVGCSSTLVILQPKEVNVNEPAPQGIVVAILVNMEAVSLTPTARKVALAFEKIEKEVSD